MATNINTNEDRAAGQFAAAVWFALLRKYRIETLERHTDRIQNAIGARLCKAER